MATVTSIKTAYPMDSYMTTGEDGLPVYDREYHAADLRTVMKTFLTDGVFTDMGDCLSVTEEGGTWSVGTGGAMADGLFVPVESAMEVIDQSEISTGQYAFIVIAARFETDYRDGAVYSVVSSSPAYAPVRDGSTWELVLARVDWRGGLTDYRLDASMCGAVAPFEPVDTDDFMLELKTAVSQFNLNVGEVSSLPSGSTPAVTVRKPVTAGGEVYVDFGIPRGTKGEPGQSAPGVYLQEERPEDPSEGTLWLGSDPDTRQIEHIEVYEVTGTYPGETYPGEKYPGGSAAWAAYTIDPALVTSAQS